MLEINSTTIAFGGKQLFCQHQSNVTATAMTFSVFLPPKAQLEKCPVLYWLSGLTCTEENFTTKSGFQRIAAELGLIVVAPDTSPRGCQIEGEDDSYDLGTGAGFYLDATEEKWQKNYRMFSYITEELPTIINANFPTLPQNVGITGHSMGGHGALICALKKEKLYKSVSAFAPIVAPTQCPWGQKAFANYLGDDKQSWQEWDAVELLKSGKVVNKILIDQGTKDNFCEEQLKPHLLEEVCREKSIPLELNLRENYDHSYYFIASFIENHLRWHEEQLRR